MFGPWYLHMWKIDRLWAIFFIRPILGQSPSIKVIILVTWPLNIEMLLHFWFLLF